MPFADGFTSSDWFQLLYPALWFLIGWLVGGRGSITQTTVQGPTSTSVSIVQAIEVHVDRPKAGNNEAPKRDESTDPWEEILLFVVGGLAAIAALAYAYVQWRDIALAIAATLLAASLGLVAGTVRRKMELGLFAGDWRWAVAMVLVLASAAVGCGYFLLNPLAGPPEYSVLFNAYRQEGWTALLSWDANVWLFAYQALGAALLILASGVLLWVAAGVVSKGAIIAGAAPSRVRLHLARTARSPAVVLLSFLVVLLFLTGAFVFGTGYASRWVGAGGKSDTPQVLVPRVSRTGAILNVDGVASASGQVELELRFARQGREPKRSRNGATRKRRSTLRFTWTVARGRIHRMQRLRKANGTLLAVTLTPMRASGVAGDDVRFRCGPAGRCVRQESSETG